MLGPRVEFRCREMLCWGACFPFVTQIKEGQGDNWNVGFTLGVKLS